MEQEPTRPSGFLGAGLHALEEALIAFLVVAMAAATLYGLVAGLFGFAPVTAFDSSRYLLAGLVLLGMSYAVKVNAHLGVDAFVKLFGPTPRRVFGLLAVIAGLAYGLLMLVGAWQHLAERYADQAGGPPWQLSVILPAGFALLMLRLAQAGLRIWRHQQEGLLEGDEVAEALQQHMESLSRSTGDGAAAGKAKQP